MGLVDCNKYLGNGTYTECTPLVLATGKEFVKTVASTSGPLGNLSLATIGWAVAQPSFLLAVGAAVGATLACKKVMQYRFSANLERVRQLDLQMSAIELRIARYKCNIAKLTEDELQLLSVDTSFATEKDLVDTYGRCVNACEILVSDIINRQKDGKWFCTDADIAAIDEYEKQMGKLVKKAANASGLISAYIKAQDDIKMDIGGTEDLAYADITRAVDWSHEASV